MVLLLKLKQWAWQLGALVLVVLGFVTRIKYLEHQREKAEVRAAVAEAKVHIKAVEKKVEKKRKESLRVSLEETRKTVEEEKEKPREQFKGLPDLSDPNKW